MLTNLSLTQKVIFVLVLTLVVQIPFVISLALMQSSVTHQIDEELRIQAIIARLNKVSNLWSSLTTNSLRMMVRGTDVENAPLPDYNKLFKDAFQEIELSVEHNEDQGQIRQLEEGTKSALGLLAILKKSWIERRTNAFNYKPEEGVAVNARLYEIAKLVDICFDTSNQLIDQFLAKQNSNHLAQSRSQLLWKVALLTGLSLNFILIIAIAYLFTREVALKFSLITDNSLRLTNGMALNPPLPGNDEISVLDQQFHKMADSIVSANIKERAVVDNALDLICSLSANGVFLSVNPAAQQILGYKPSEFLSKSYIDIVAEADKERTESMLKSLISGETMAPFEHGAIRKNGSNVELEMLAHWSNPDQSLFCVIYDVTQRRQIERVKREFTDVLTHDLRVPLLNTRNTLELIYSDCDDESTAITQLKQVSLEIKPIQKLISDLLELEKIDAAMLTLNLKRINLPVIIEEAVESVREQASENGIIVRTELSDAIIEVDKTRLLQALTTLLENSLRRSPPGSSVAVTCRQDELACIDISDSGPRVSTDEQERIFEPFRQTRLTADENLLEGTSLGLAVCKSIIAAHHGAIGVMSKGPVGSTFWIQLPLTQ